MAPLHLGSPINLAAIGLLIGVAYIASSAIYNRFFHPLSKYPGPFSHHVSYLPRAYALLSGKLGFHVADLHKQYGPVVRITPNELAFSSPQAWRDIYGHKKSGEPEFPKSELFYRVFTYLPLAIINADRDEHALLRRQLSHGFSDRSMKEQEPIIGSYVNLLVQRIRENLDKAPNAPLNMLLWLNWTAFDIIGDLGFGAAGGFGCLEQSDYHPWVRIITDNMRQSAFMQALSSIGLRDAIQWIAKRRSAAGSQHRAIIQEKVAQRLKLGASRPDFLEGLIRKKEELNLDMGRLNMNASLIIIAGSETTSTLLCGTLYLLTTNLEVLKRLENEVRTTFQSDEEITLTSVNQLSYMLAVLNEALREYPPVVIGLPRVAPSGGGVVDGNPVPQGTIVSVFQWAINHNERFWKDPFKFAPERFLNDEKYKTDQLDAMQPFGIGPRNCIGQNLAYAEMRLVLAKLVYNFDMSIAEEARDWLRGQKAYTSWVKPNLPIYMKPATRAQPQQAIAVLSSI
ncbi:cytochrome P450 [Xylaria acuta]|nr:cytochrome P450 [Xylaria acuta]